MVTNNLSSHKAADVRRAIKAAEAKLIFPPPYSPDLNPIEQAFSQLETLLRKADARGIEQTTTCIGKLLDQVTARRPRAISVRLGYAT